MKIKCLLLWLLMLVSPAAFGHRLNEYLQAATISLSRDKVLIQYRLTPGVAVAPTILKGIDADGNGKLSAAEQQAYLAVVGHDISLNVDGHSIALNAITYTFPTIEELEKGLGDIIIQYEIKIDTASASHQIQLKNTHYKSTGVYLVNCLLPADTAIHVTGQNRNADQSFYQLNFTIGHVQQGAIQQGSLEKADHQAVVKTYLVHGVKHILGGYDHLLFLCALVLGAAGLWDLVKIVTAFTIAHSITLTLATFGLAHLPEQVVEPMIAASIVFVAVQNIFWPKQAGGYNRLAIAFFFGLFHGLGFAGGLLQLMHAMPTSLVVYAILGFSLGVEAGNQLVLLPLYGTLRLIQARTTKTPTQRMLTIKQYASGAVALAGMYYLCADLCAFL